MWHILENMANDSKIIYDILIFELKIILLGVDHFSLEILKYYFLFILWRHCDIIFARFSPQLLL